ncbi:winged helix DNA-binding domain-containing protein [Spirillospora albida]|uniref:winged helix DNA-binding domain-containing protein n=1 Tax=Spirillospora albida TaxID=58123 RepID=UPI0004C03FAA|nr:winged helix DNA-binding domain-containing protein [Spirillospora albida]
MRTLDTRTLNRAALDRQLLLRRSGMSAPEAVRHLVAVQAQEPNSPYHALWTRLETFRQDDLTGLLHDRSVVRAALLRGTQHMTAADDYLWIRPLVHARLLSARQSAFGRVTRDWDLDALAAEAVRLLSTETLTRPQLARALTEIWPGRDVTALGWTVQALVPVVHPPPGRTWNTFGAVTLALAEDWIGAPLHPDPAPDALIRRYLAAFGPASVKDFQTWSGLRRTAADFERLRPTLRVFRDENGAELFDVPDGPLPDPDTHAPVRFLPDFDNLVLAYADRSRLMTPERRAAVCIGSETKPVLLVDGRVQATWELRHDRKAAKAVLTVAPFEPLTADIGPEAAALLAFTAPDADHDVRLAPRE